MKKKITKIWGVGLTLVIAASLILWTAPVSAGTLSWSSEDLPDELELGTDVVDLAVSVDGGVIYATTDLATDLEPGDNITYSGGTGFGEWSTEQVHSGAYSAKLTATGSDWAEVTLIPTVTITLDDLASIGGLGWWYYIATADFGGKGTALELYFESATDADGWAEMTIMDKAYGTVAHGGPPTLDAWTEQLVDSTTTGFVFGNTEADVTIEDYPPPAQGEGTVAAMVAHLKTEDTNAGDWVLTEVRPTLGWITATQTIAYIDDVTINGLVFRSSDAGEGWSTLSNPTGAFVPKLVAVAPDDEDYIAIVADGTEVYVSDDAGANWDELIFTTAPTSINDLALSAAKSGNHFVAIAGVDVSDAAVWYYEIGAVGAAWKDASGDAVMGTGFTAGDIASAVAFSPNFASDEVMVAVTADNTSVLFQLFSFDQKEWNADAGFTDYPVDLTQDTPTPTITLDSASIALSPDYLGGDDAMRLAFVGITVNGGDDAEETSGIQRIEDDDNDVLKDDVHIHSVDFDGTNLVAGRYDTTTVYRCADPLGSSPSVKSSAGFKSPGGDTLVVVAWAGSDVVAGTSGDESAFAVSESDGKTFNDISLIDTALTNLSDVAVSPDGSNAYLITDDGSALSLWRYASVWERVFAVDDKTDFIVRLAPDDDEVLYVAEKGSTKIYYSADAGQAKWHTRISTEDIDDLTVETDGSVVYVATAGGYVSKSTNGGFTWGSKKSSKLSAISMLISLGEDLLLAGSTDGKAAYSTDGNLSWTKLSDGMTSGVVSVIADGLDEGDLVVAGVDTVSDHLYRWDWDDEEWEEIGDLDTSYGTYGIALQGGVLYAVGAEVGATDNISSLYRSLNPTSDDPDWNTIDSADEKFSLTPSALRVSVSDTTVKLWAIDSVAPALFSYKDTLAAVAPTLLAPREGFENLMNPITGQAFDITFSWVRPSKEVTAYDFQIALDSAFNEVVLDQVLVKDSSTVGVVAGPAGSTIEGQIFKVEFMPDTTYYWKVRVDEATIDSTDYGPIRSQWSEVRSFKIEEAPVAPAVTVAPTPEITIAVPPAPTVVLPAPEIIIPTPEIVLPAPQITLPPTPAPVAPIPSWALYLIIIIGAVLVIALIVLILRTRRPV